VTDAAGCTKTGSGTVTQPPDIVLSTSITPVNCYGGSTGNIDLTVTGGSSPYSYHWLGGATTQDRTNLNAGIYAVTITDAAGCTENGIYVVTQSSDITLSANVTPVTCNGGSNGAIDITVTGGTSPYYYYWNDGTVTGDRTNLSAGIYAVTITDAAGCTENGVYIVLQSSEITLSADVTPVSCNGGSDGAIDLTVTGGTAPYTYLWNDGAVTQDRTNLSAGIYAVTVTDAVGCTENGVYIVLQSSEITLSADVTPVSCNGGSNGAIDLTVTGGTAPYTYLWNDGAVTEDRNNISAGIYSVTVTDAEGCTENGICVVLQSSEITLSANVTPVSCNGGSDGAIDLTVTGGTAPYTYLWNDGAVTEDRTNLNAGTYSVTLTDTHGCTVFGSYIVTEPAALAISYLVSDVTVSGGSDGSIDVTVSGGVVFYSYYWSTGSTTQDLTGLTAGTYYLTVSDGNSCTAEAIIHVNEPSGGYDSQIVDLVSGWSMISTYIIPLDSSLEVIFSPVVSSIIIMKNGSGFVYWPAYGLDQIGHISIGEGYQIKMTSFQQITVTGTAAIPELTPINCPVGWSIIGYLRQLPGNIETMLSSLGTNIIIVKNGAGQVYWPSVNLNIIGNMVPGQGYQIKLSSAGTLLYPPNSVTDLKTGLIINIPVHYIFDTPTGDNMTIGIPGESWETVPEPGDEIGIFDDDGILCGSTVFTGGFTAVTAWGKEIMGTNDFGSNGIYFSMKLWHHSDNSTENIIVQNWIEGSGEYVSNGINIIGKITLNGVQIINEFYLGQNIPNPFISKTRIPFCLAESCHVTVKMYNSIGQLAAELISTNINAGYHEITFDANGFPSGVYYYRLITEKFTATRSLIIK
jgi:sulfur transfer complex TusBCD TusB component (DsrH family)